MTNNLLTDIKELGLDQDKALEILKAHKKAEGKKDKEEEEQEEQGEEEQSEGKDKDEKNKKPLDIDIKKLASDITKNVSESVSKTVSAEIKKQIKKLRGSPPKGEDSQDFIGNDPFVKKNLFERRI